MKSYFPNLQIIPIKNAVLHEEVDAKRASRLKQQLLKDGFIKNPVMVSLLKNGKFVVLDGANRVTALKQIGCKYIFVQILKYQSPFIKITTWNHLICDPKFKAPNKKIFHKNQIFEMKNFTNQYKGKFSYVRVIENDLKVLQKTYPKASSLIVFPKFTPRDIENIVNCGEKIPAGISRHIINGRALRITCPLKLLKRSGSLAAKNLFLKKIINKLNKENKIRLYEEPVFLFDE